MTGSTTRVEDGDDCSERVWGSVTCDVAMAAKSTVGGWPERRALVSIRDRASATTLSGPRTCRMVEVN